MNPSTVVDLTREAIVLTLMMGAPIIISAALIGLIISFLQALTQIQDQTLAFAFKTIVVFILIAVLGGWLGTLLLQFGIKMFDAVGTIR